MLVFGNGFKLTSKGKQMVSSGASYSFSKIVLGAGTYTSAEDATTRTALKSQKQTFDVSNTSVDGTTVTIAGVISNASLSEGYTITEAGVIAKDSTGAEHLFLIGVATLSDPMPAHNDNIPDVICDMKIKYTTSNTSKVSLSVPETAFARALDLKDVKSQLAQTANYAEANYAKKNEVTNIMTPKGTLAYALLPQTGNTIGWYYYCPDGDGTHGAGNYAWNGTTWYFGGTGDEGYSKLKDNTLGNYKYKDYAFPLSSQNYMSYRFEAGHLYKIKNNSSSSSVTLQTIASVSNRIPIESIGTLSAQALTIFNCNTDAEGIYIYCNGKANVIIIDITNLLEVLTPIEQYFMYDVTLYGIIPSNEDNYNALVNLINSIPQEHAVLYFPSGTYNFSKHTDYIQLPSKCTIIGDGIDKTIIKFNDSDEVGVSLFKPGTDSISLKGITFRSTFDINRSKTNIAFLMYGTQCNDVHISKCKFLYWRGICMEISNVINVVIEHSEYKYIGRDSNRFLNAKKTDVYGNLFDHCGDDIVAFTQISQSEKSDYGHQFYNNRMTYSMGLCYLGCTNVNVHDNQFIRYMYIIKAGETPEDINEGGRSWNIRIEHNTFTTPICSIVNGQGRFSSRFVNARHVIFKDNIFTKPEVVTKVAELIFIENWITDAVCDNFLTTISSASDDNDHFVIDNNYFYNQFDATTNTRLLNGTMPKYLELKDNYFTATVAQPITLELKNAVVRDNYFGFSATGIIRAYNGNPLIDKGNMYRGISGYVGANDNYCLVTGDIPISPASINNIKIDASTGGATSMKLQRSATMPTSGTYFKGDFVYCSDGGNTDVFGWKRITNGEAHVINVDWIEIKITK